MDSKGGTWYKGTANAIYQNIGFIDLYDPEYVVVLSGDHIYKMDYHKMVAHHKETGAECTISVMERSLTDKLTINFGKTAEEASDEEMMKASALVLRDVMAVREVESRLIARRERKKQVHYLSLEFLMGRSLMKNAYNLNVLPQLRAALEHLGFKAADIFELEPDAGLGNGGLGRLAACYLDSMGFIHDVTRLLDKMNQRKNLGMFSATISREVMTNKRKWDGGILEPCVDVEKGVIKNIVFYGDFLAVCAMEDPVLEEINALSQRLDELEKELKKTNERTA